MISKLFRLPFYTFAARKRPSSAANRYSSYASNSADAEPEPAFTNMDKELFEQYRNRLSADTILNDFRREVFKRQDQEELMQAQKTLDKQGLAIQKMLGRGSKDEIVRKAKKLGQRFTNKQNVFLGNSLKSTISDYADYTIYNSVKTVLKDRNLQEDEQLDDDHSHKRLYNFIDKLDNQYQEKIDVRDRLDLDPQNPQYRDISVKELGRIVQDDIDYAAWNLKLRRDYSQSQQFNKVTAEEDITTGPTHQYSSIERSLDPYDLGPSLNATLSPQAMDTIFQLYTQGWSVREISQRFGILPARTKFCIWARAYLWHQVLPKLGASYYMDALKQEYNYEDGISFVDYGLDIEQINSNTNIGEITEWNKRMLDTQRKQEEYKGFQLAAAKLDKQRIMGRYEMVEVGTFGKDNYMYKLKEWRRWRGKGSDQYHLKNTTFRKMSKEVRKFSKVYY